MEVTPLKANTILVLWVFCSLWCASMLEKVVVDMTGQGCFDTGERQIRDDQVFSVMASYRPNLQPTVDHCDVSLRAVESNRRLEYLMDKLTIFDCGITIWLYDNPQLVSQPTRIIRCSDDKQIPISGKTSHGVIKISLRKESTQATAYEFQIHVKTDYGPPFDFVTNEANFYEPPLDTGAIVGIVIAGSVFIIAIAGLAIFCCIKARMNNRRKYAEASDGKSAPPSSIYTTGSTRDVYQPSASKQHSSHDRGGHPRPPPSQDSTGRSPSKQKGDDYNSHTPYRDDNGHTPYKDVSNSVYTNKKYNHENFTNQAHENEKFDRQASVRGSQKRRQNDAPHDDPDHANMKGDNFSRHDTNRASQRKREQDSSYEYVDIKGGNLSRHDSSQGSHRKHPDASYKDADTKGGHISRRDSSRGSSKKRHNDTSFDNSDHKGGHVSRRDSSKSNRVKYSKKTNYSRNDYGSVGRSKKHGNGHQRARSRSPSQGSMGSTVDSNTLVYGYSRTSTAHPNTAEDRDPRSRSRSGSRARAGSQRSGSISRSRAGSVGRSDSRPRVDSRDTQKAAPKNARQYGDMSDFLPEQDHHRSRSRSAGSMGKSSRR